ncbi:ATP-binding protein [Streptomyces sp. NPDC088387]|uniref:ATP-binding protein n=1 Tax=Streptomyces sp. NPDC088387 TaxID=3365859 RepID=UPI003818FCAE
MPSSDVTEPRLRCVLPFEAAPSEVRLLRRAATKQLSRWGFSAGLEEAELLVTELATNVVKHVGEGAIATLVLEWRCERLRLEVHDRSAELPFLQLADCDAECGRGLHLLATMATDWGAVLTAAGKAVWCEVPVNGGTDCRRIERAVAALDGYRGVWDDGRKRQGRATDLHESAVELIADLLHWTSAQGHDPDDVLERAQMHYEAEAEAA